MVSPIATREMPAAEAMSIGSAEGSTRGTLGAGKPCGSEPMTSTPLAARSNKTTARIDTTTAASTPGILECIRFRPTMRARSISPMANANTFVWPRFCQNAAISGNNPSASTENPNSLGNCPTTIVTASPARYPTRMGRESKSATKPSFSTPAAVHSTPTISASVLAYATAASWLPAASGRMTAAIMAPSAESGPSTRNGDGPKAAYATRQTTVVYRP